MGSDIQPGSVDGRGPHRGARDAGPATRSGAIARRLPSILPQAWSAGSAIFPCLLAALAALHSSALYGQALPTAGDSGPSYGVMATANFANTQLPSFADNAAGFNIAAFVQSTPLLGFEIRGGAYPIAATFEQAPVTGGLRFAEFQSRILPALPFLYVGAGFSKAQYSKANYQPSVALWSPCWQASTGMDRPMRSFTWRVFEVSWTQTHTLRRNIRTLGVSTGLIFTFKR